VKELYDRLDGGTRAAGSVAGLIVDAAKQPAAGITAEQLQALFQQHDSVSD
jgi:exopolysaccharide biosynthesis protein